MATLTEEQLEALPDEQFASDCHTADDQPEIEPLAEERRPDPSEVRGVIVAAAWVVVLVVVIVLLEVFAPQGLAVAP